MMEYELLKEIDAQYLIEYLTDINNSIINWSEKLNHLHDEYLELKEVDPDNEYAIIDKKEEFNDSSKSYYNELITKMKRTKLEVISIYNYIIKDKMFLEMISDRELLTYFRECSDISEEITKNAHKLTNLSLSNKNVKEYKKGYEYNLLDIDSNFYDNYNDEVENLYLEDTSDYFKSVSKEINKSAKGTLTLKKMIKNHTIRFK